MTPLVRSRAAALAAACAWLVSARGAAADPYRLRADTFASGSTSPVGLVVLQGEQREAAWFDAEALVWVGSGDRNGDAMVAAVGVRDPHGRGELRAGRMMLSTGAVRPLHLDGLTMTGRAPWGTSLQVFGGMPVEPAFGARDYDWVAGQRLAQSIGTFGAAGVSYVQRRDAGQLAFSELGGDVSIWPVRWFDAAAVTLYDLPGKGITDARLTTALRSDKVRVEVSATRRSPSRLLPATSLFAALGDRPSDTLGGNVSWRAAPRLDLAASGSIESIGGDLGGEQWARATLRLDPRGDRAIGLEVRRSGAPDASWTGSRGTLRWPLTMRLRASTELEIVAPDAPNGRGSVWPWGLLALGYDSGSWWDAAAAVEANASPSDRAALSALARFSGHWEGP